MSRTKRYDDIIHLPHPVSKRHPQMPREKRAAQFSPFAALIGYDEALAEMIRPLVKRIELSDDEKERLNRKLQELMAKIQEHPKVTVTWFQQDAAADGGIYVTTTDRLEKIDATKRCFMLQTKGWIVFDDIFSIH